MKLVTLHVIPVIVRPVDWSGNPSASFWACLMMAGQ